MGLSDIAAGIESTTKQQTRQVTTIDDTDISLRERLDEHESELPCTAAAAATVLEAYDTGTGIEAAAMAAGVAPVTAAKTLYRCGNPGIMPLTPGGRQVLSDWLAGQLSRVDALALTQTDESTFALAAYIETHGIIEPIADVVRRDVTNSLREDTSISNSQTFTELTPNRADL
ncbi:hypothetical protein [Haloquadratum walsbyi]|uniref:Uncharacterized protein n=1 Tax=Haloquadratum walsbyi J07HQW2 TaxID=1238425 RepID=U1PPZ1_9EURY|nr:hypothetical protein [Haloquadratum walsbyi]ERG95832.1 MAG: hypothetical protein J07HQW2_02292 [Haloquadratum walsbyi J07HQW2]